MPNIGLFSEIKNQATQINVRVNNISTMVYLVLIYLRWPMVASDVHPHGSLLAKFEDRVNIKYS